MNQNPFEICLLWLEREGYKLDQNGYISPNLPFTLATCGKDLKPGVRVLYLKRFLENSFMFFTNKNSLKGIQITENSNVSACIFFENTTKQIRISGTAVEAPAKFAEEYFNMRPAASRASSILSKQSQILKNPEEFESQITSLASQEQNLQRPENWVCYRIIPEEFEFWEGAQFRVNIRNRFKKDLNSENFWFKEVLYP